MCYTFLLDGKCKEQGTGTGAPCKFRHMSADELVEYLKLHHSSVMEKLKFKLEELGQGR